MNKLIWGEQGLLKCPCWKMIPQQTSIMCNETVRDDPHPWYTIIFNWTECPWIIQSIIYESYNHTAITCTMRRISWRWSKFTSLIIQTDSLLFTGNDMVDKREAVMIDQSKNACKRLWVYRKTVDGKKPHSGDVKQISSLLLSRLELAEVTSKATLRTLSLMEF